MWTRFMDMHSGGGTKEPPYEYIYIEASEDEAVTIFYNRFGHNPNRVTCTCCGSDYSISNNDDLAQVTAYERNCDYDESGKHYIERPAPESYRQPYRTLEEYMGIDGVLFICADDIKPEECAGEVPLQGYVWVD